MNIANIAALIGAGLAMGLGGIGPGWGIGYATARAVKGMARQPAVEGSLFRNMLIGQAITETPAIFSLVIAFLLVAIAGEHLDAPNSLGQAAVFVGAALCIGIGSFGSGAGGGIVAANALGAMARTPSSQGRVMMLMLIGQAWAQTGCIFSLVIALLMLNAGNFGEMPAEKAFLLWDMIPITGHEVIAIGKYLGVGIGMGIGAIGSALGMSLAGGRACKALAEAPHTTTLVRTMFFVGAAVAESPTIFVLIVCIVILAR